MLSNNQIRRYEKSMTHILKGEYKKMITFFSGTPGSGKSLHTAMVIYNNLFKKKNNVICNFDINQDIYNSKKKKGKFEYITNLELDVEYLKNFALENHKTQKEGQTLLIIDECQLLFNSIHSIRPFCCQFLELNNN